MGAGGGQAPDSPVPGPLGLAPHSAQAVWSSCPLSRPTPGRTKALRQGLEPTVREAASRGEWPLQGLA